ncbi:MAG TPA: amidohydrolase [Clostridiaceae bacterium]|nr:amidohydrolase [Clostridiaceae bacterium]
MKDELIGISKYIYENPETGFKEFKAQDILTKTLGKYGFSVEKNFIGLGTEFKATFGSGSPSIAYLCEYDALPGIGHGCGHNLIATMGLGAAVGLSKVINGIGGKVVVFGTPAEETSGAKVTMVEKGAFKDIDAAIIVHPSDSTHQSGTSLAIDAIEFTFIGKPAHAAANPENGINALNACIETFNMINALRQHVKSDVRIHGIIAEGGVAANIVPERAVARFYVRALDRSYLNEVVEKVKNCARAAAMAVGAKIEIRNYELSYDNMITNNSLSAIFTRNLKECGVTDIKGSDRSMGSIDMGNVSHVVPSIHPYIKICREGIAGHTREFAQATVEKLAGENIIKAACAMALTGYDLITDKNLLSEVKEEFQRQKSLS